MQLGLCCYLFVIELVNRKCAVSLCQHDYKSTNEQLDRANMPHQVSLLGLQVKGQRQRKNQASLYI